MDLIWVFVIIAIGLAIAGLVYWRLGTRKEKRIEKKKGNLPIDYPYTQADFKYSYVRANCPHIQSVAPVPEEAIAAIIEGLNMTQRAVRRKFPSWMNGFKLESVNIAIINPQGSHPEFGFPELLINVKDLAGKVIQQVATAGTVLGLPGHNVSPMVIVIPHQAATDWRFLEYLRNTARNEYEHFLEFANDLYEAQKYTGTYDIHPHHLLEEEEAQAVKGFAGLRLKQDGRFACAHPTEERNKVPKM